MHISKIASKERLELHEPLPFPAPETGLKCDITETAKLYLPQVEKYLAFSVK